MRPFLQFIVKLYFKWGKVTGVPILELPPRLFLTLHWALGSPRPELGEESMLPHLTRHHPSTVFSTGHARCPCRASSWVKETREKEAWRCGNTTDSRSRVPDLRWHFTWVKRKPNKQQMFTVLKIDITGPLMRYFPHFTRNGKFWSFCKLFWEVNQLLVFCNDYCQIDHEAACVYVCVPIFWGLRDLASNWVLLPISPQVSGAHL